MLLLMEQGYKFFMLGFCKSTKLINYHECNFYIPMLGFVGGDQQHEKEEEVVVVVQLHAERGAFSLLDPVTGGLSGGLYDKPLLCFGCGIGWFSFLMGFVFPPLWYYATVLYFGIIIIKIQGSDQALQHLQLQP
ncbi:hypothetical protein CK203_042865 [Vitis vinifera]|uniref:Uncharacterized protein n=1 Tax=Vitis vinifera TaxID=29760 RepID=A0A438HUN0_VITVI|nr:hypothetical protein CK203_042865 [Vitis vinifera]